MASNKGNFRNGAISEGLTSLLDFPSDGSVSLSDLAVRQAIYEAYRGVDFYTGQPLSVEEMRLDHVFPRSQGGPDSAYNLVPTCARVNGEKAAKVDPSTIGGVLYLVRTIYAPAIIDRLQKGDDPKRERQAKVKSEVFPFSGSYSILVSDSEVKQVTISTDRPELLDILNAADKQLFRMRERKSNPTVNPLHALQFAVFDSVTNAVGSHYRRQLPLDEIFSEGGNASLTAPVYYGRIKRELPSPETALDDLGLELDGETIFEYKFKIEEQI